MNDIVRRLFLLGGSLEIFEDVAKEFIPAACGENAVIALLLSGKPGWEDHVLVYSAPWIQRNIARFNVVVPDKQQKHLDIPATLTLLREATGIFIGGGETPIYRQLYATDPVRNMIIERYRQGVPIAGISAGTLIAPQICPIPPEDTGEPAVRLETGIGLLDNLIVGVHFSEWNALPHVLDAMRQTRTERGLGIDEGACVMLENEQIHHVLGESAYEITMTDFDTAEVEASTYHITKLA
jgi:cyanophycinase